MSQAYPTIEASLETSLETAPVPRSETGLSRIVSTPRKGEAHEPGVVGHARRLLESLGLNLADEHLRDTPRRMARALQELCSGATESSPRLTTFPNTGGSGEMILLSDVSFHSLCAHHFLPFFGHAQIAYVPGDRLVGLSKPARVMEHFARRPQVQEQLTEQVVAFLSERLEARGVIVRLKARHLCMEMRGVRRSAWTTTTATRGVFEHSAWRAEFSRETRQEERG